MDNKMLAVKFRPKKFSEVQGQQHVVVPIKNALQKQSLSHALLLFGPSGTGKTTLARIIAKSVNCTDQKNGEPCCICPNCKKIDAETSVDLIEFDAATNGGVNEIREIQAQVQSASLSNRCRVFIIDEAHMLTNQASNALLKTLEEPPKNVMFILATTELNKILPTIKSRCQKYSLTPLRFKEVKDCLQSIAKTIGVEFEPAALDLMCRASNGGMREAIQFLEKAVVAQEKTIITLKEVAETFGAISFNLLFSFWSHIMSHNASSLITYVDNIIQDGINLNMFWGEFQQLVRATNITKKIKDMSVLQRLLHYDDISIKQISETADKLDQISLLNCWKLVIEIQNQLEMTAVAGRIREVIEEASIRLSTMSFEEMKTVSVPVASSATPAAKPNFSGLPVFANNFKKL